MKRHFLWSMLILALWLALHSSTLLGRAWGNAGMVALTRALIAVEVGEPPQTFNQAERLLQRAVAHEPGNDSLWRGLGLALVAQGKGEQAAAAWHTAGVTAQDFFWWAERARETQRYEEALVWFQEAANMEPAWGAPWYQMGLVYKAQKEWSSAVRAYQQAAQRLPDNRNVWYELGLAQQARREFDLALQTFQRGLTASEGRLGLSSLYFHIGSIQQTSLSPPDLDAAWAAYEQALALDDYQSKAWQKAETYYMRGRILTSHKSWDDAVKQYHQVLALDPHHYRAYVGLAAALLELGEREQAKTTLLKAIEVEPKRKDAYLRLGNLYLAEGDTAAARTVYSKVLELDPRDDKARQALDALNNSEP